MPPEQKKDERLPIFRMPQKTFEGFIGFIRERGVAGLAIGFVLGTSVQKVVTSFVDNIINPAVGMMWGKEALAEMAVGPFKIGAVVTTLIDFLILIFIVYIVYKALHLDVFDKPKE
jgi:large conductance mechanosensitive channel